MGDYRADRRWIDDLRRKHEWYTYDPSPAPASIQQEGRSFELIVPEWFPPFSTKAIASQEDLLFLIGEQLDEEDEDGRVIEGGDGLLIVARKRSDSVDCYQVLVRHVLFPMALDQLGTP